MKTVHAKNFDSMLKIADQIESGKAYNVNGTPYRARPLGLWQGCYCKVAYDPPHMIWEDNIITDWCMQLRFKAKKANNFWNKTFSHTINYTQPKITKTLEGSWIWMPWEPEYVSHNNPWHILIDCISKYYVLEKKYGMDAWTFPVVMPKLPEYMKKVMRVIHPGWEYNVTEMGKGEYYKIDHAIVPSVPNHDDGVIHPSIVDYLYKKVKTHLRPSNHKKIYIDRKAPTRKVHNAGEIKQLLIDNGYKIFLLEDMSVIDQMNLFAGADSIVANHGAGITNVLWSKPGTKIIELTHPMSVKKVYSNLAHCKNLKYHCVIGEAIRVNVAEKLHRDTDYYNILVDKTELAKYL